MQPPDRVMAAPNHCEIRATILKAARSPDWPDKWLLEIDIKHSDSQAGPNFAKPGKARAFAFADTFDFAPGTEVLASAEYIGGASDGSFKLENVRPDP